MALRPGNLAARLALGVLYCDAENWDDAAQCLYEYLQDDGHNIKALAYYGRTLQGLNNYPAALKVFEIAHSLQPTAAFSGAIDECRAQMAQKEADQRRPHWAKSISGTASSVVLKASPRSARLSFTLTVQGKNPGVLRVAMTGGSIIGGTVAEGHEVEIPLSSIDGSGTSRTKEIYNISTGREISCGTSQVFRRGVRMQTGFRLPPGYRGFGG